MDGETRVKLTDEAIASVGARAPAAASARGCWFGWQFSRSTALRNLSTMLQIVNLPADLISSRGHDGLLVNYRMQFLSARIGAMLTFLAIATIAWIPLDIMLFHSKWEIVFPLAVGRVVTAAVFLAIGSAQARGICKYQPVAALAASLITGIGFFFFAHAVIGHGDSTVVASAGHGQYIVMPLALAIGISLFPLTLIEASLLALLPLVAFLIEMLLFDGKHVWFHPSLAVLLIGFVMLVTTAAAISQLVLLKELFGKSAFDSLTGAISRLAGTELLTIMFEHARRTKEPLSLLLIDLDRFKAVNDGHGHEAGDQLLREVGDAIRRRLRQQDAVIRWGGEELVVVLPNTTASQGAHVASAICRHGLALRPDGSPQTASIGLAERISDQVAQWENLVEIADARMYMAKELGRNRLKGSDILIELSVGVAPVLNQSAAPFSAVESGLSGARLT